MNEPTYCAAGYDHAYYPRGCPSLVGNSNRPPCDGKPVRARKIIVSGGRDFLDWAAVYRELVHYPEGTVLVHGDCRRGHNHPRGEECPAACDAWRSADRIADRIGRALGFVVIRVPADWGEHGKAAGPIRNTVMVKIHSNAERAIVFDGGPGTRDFTRKAVEAHIPVYGGGRTDRINLSLTL